MSMNDERIVLQSVFNPSNVLLFNNTIMTNTVNLIRQSRIENNINWIGF